MLGLEDEGNAESVRDQYPAGPWRCTMIASASGGGGQAFCFPVAFGHVNGGEKILSVKSLWMSGSIELNPCYLVPWAQW